METDQTKDPLVSIVIGSQNAARVISDCLSALFAQIQPGAAEIIVCDSSADGTDEIIRRDFPEVRLLHFDQPLNFAIRYGRAIALAHGEIIAVLAPYAIPSPNWYDELVKAHSERSNWIIGGTVDLFQAERQGYLTWAQYLYEYAMFMSPLPEGEMEILPGSNLSYKRPALFSGEKPRQVEYWKTFTNWELEESGHAMWESPEMRVYLKKPIPFGDFLRTRFHHGRCFAGQRAVHENGVERIGRALTCPLLPGVLLYRWGRRFWPKRRWRRKFLLTLPVQALLFGYWAVGEFIGYLFGTGKSCSQLYY